MGQSGIVVVLGLGGVAVDRAWVTRRRMLSADSLVRRRRLGSTCCMTSVDGIFLGATAKLRPSPRTRFSVSVSWWLLRLMTVFWLAGAGWRVVRVSGVSLSNFLICFSLVCLKIFSDLAALKVCILVKSSWLSCSSSLCWVMESWYKHTVFVRTFGAIIFLNKSCSCSWKNNVSIYFGSGDIIF